MSNGSFKIEIENCNNIASSSLSLNKEHLNILYALNGSGKSTIAKVIEVYSKNEALEPFKTFGSKEEPKINISNKFESVFVFNEDFVNTLIFKESEVIKNSFEVFIKTEKYDEKLAQLNNRLRELKIDIGKDKEVIEMLQVFDEIESKIPLNKDNNIRNNTFFKSLLKKDNLFNIPEKLKKFECFFHDKENNIDWIDWKNKGANFDSNNDCPFCAEHLPEAYQEEKEVFTKTYNKASAEHLKYMLGYLEKLQPYINSKRYDILVGCIKTEKDQDNIRLNLKEFREELSFLKGKIRNSVSFDSHSLKSDEIGNIGDTLDNLKINLDDIDCFNSKKSNSIINMINKRLTTLLNEVDDLKQNLGGLKGIIESQKTNAVSDINHFLKQAGINYEIYIDNVSESESNTLLRYISRTKEKYNVENIKRHLSWGEKNAFALILFMYYSISKKVDLIILDDPVSSFDGNKKYAIISRIFKNTEISFYKKNSCSTYT